MHYKNGREAKENDLVIGLDTYVKKVFVGQAHSLVAGATSCNCQVTVISPGMVSNRCSTIGELYHAEDCLLAIEPLALAPKA